MDVIQCCIIIGWTYLASSSFILFASNLEWLVTKNTRRNIFTTIFLCSLHRGIITKGESSCCLSKSACFRTEARPWETFESHFRLVRWFPLQHQPLGAYLKIHANEICNIYDKHMHLQPPFQSLYEQKV